MRIVISSRLLLCLFCAMLSIGTTACLGGGDGSTHGDDNTGGGGGPADTCDDTPETIDYDTELTVCNQTSEAYAGETVPACGSTSTASTDCDARMNTDPPAHRCGSMIGCPLERNETITQKVETTYTPGPDDYVPPEPPHDNEADPISPMGTWMHASSTAWFPRPTGETQTMRDTDQPGSCGIWAKDLMILAIPTPQFGQNDNPEPNVWNLAYWCGACAEVVGPTGERVRVQVVTQRTCDDPQETCGDSNYYSLDLPGNQYPDDRIDTPFSMIDDNRSYCGSYGLPVDWRIVPCEVCGGIVLSYVPGYNTYTPAFRILNHRLPIVDAYQKQGGSWVRLQRDSVNLYHPVSANPLQLRIVAIDGSTIEGSFPAYTDGASYEATSQF